MKRVICLCLVGLATSIAALGADIAGNWKATANGPQGSMERTFAFQVDGERLSGETVSSFVGKSEIREGSIKGDDLSFVITINIQGNQMDARYTGKVVGDDEIKLTSRAGEFEIEWVAKRQ